MLSPAQDAIKQKKRLLICWNVPTIVLHTSLEKLDVLHVPLATVVDPPKLILHSKLGKEKQDMHISQKCVTAIYIPVYTSFSSLSHTDRMKPNLSHYCPKQS